MAAAGRITPADNIPRAAFGHYAAAAGGGRFQGNSPAAIIKSLWPSDEVSPLLVQRGAVRPATTGTAAWAGALAERGRRRVLRRARPGVGRDPPDRSRRHGSAGAAGEHQLPPAQRRARGPAVGRRRRPDPGEAYALDAATLGPAGKFATIVVLTAELAKASRRREVFEALLREDAGVSLDAAVFSDEAATDEHVAGLLNGVTPITAATGGGLGRDAGRPGGAGRRGGGGRRLGQRRLRRAPGAGRGDRDLRAGAAAAGLAVPGAGGGDGDRARPDGLRQRLRRRARHLHQRAGDDPHGRQTPVHIGTAGTPAVVAAPTRSLWQTRAIADPAHRGRCLHACAPRRRGGRRQT